MAETPSSHALKVSVIIPTYNRAAYLREALSSVFAQTLPAWEVIVVDDGSTDDTAEMLQGYGSGVRYLPHERNRGIAAARNTGLGAAQGDVIAWLDSDDLWEPEFLAHVVPLLAGDTELDGVYTGLTLVAADGARLQQATRIEPPNELYDALVRDCFLATPSLAVRKACYERVGGFDGRFQVSEDYDMWLRLAGTFRIVGLARALVRIRVHETNSMASTDALCRARLALAEKHWGPFVEDADGLSATARIAYGYAFRFIALKHIEVGQSTEGWRYLEQAAEIHPALLERLDTFYEIACGDQPRGYRGDARSLDVAASATEMIERLDSMFAAATAPVQAKRHAAFGNAYLALGMLADQAGQWGDARRFLLHAFHADANLLRSTSLLRRFVKLHCGQALVNAARSLRARV